MISFDKLVTIACLSNVNMYNGRSPLGMMEFFNRSNVLQFLIISIMSRRCICEIWRGYVKHVAEEQLRLPSQIAVLFSAVIKTVRRRLRQRNPRNSMALLTCIDPVERRGNLPCSCTCNNNDETIRFLPGAF